ncbi:hypothetical protein [Sandaracinus amylolyticus]|uniref:hypothetical protein n=1 Tax=Sandaracinus amylolyticus TaxID=927083 RepID=UPI001F2F8456|nr:hypothetical protein [Sandaracinus amylolyticus]UJR78393.1 Internalin [Sandaracinus amylolyticus]
MRTLSLLLRLALVCALALPFVACDDGAPPASDDGGTDFSRDTDGDTIADADEQALLRVDTDGDGTPDFEDADSDNDGLPDSLEAGDGVLTTGPRDSDGDGIADFRDLDSDDNGIPDAREGTEDFDEDGTHDAADLDDDNDGVTDERELGDRTDFPADHDDDGAPDFRDVDADGDAILDGHEFGFDSDGDGTPDWWDLDADDDGVVDADEAGDADVRTVPIDTDEDGIADFRDRDADNDGLPDGIELEEGTDRLEPDSDGDGVSDLIEVGAGTDPNNIAESPRTRGDFVFVMPYQEAAEPARDTLLFRTNIQYADVYFQFDTTGSMSTEIASMRGAVETIIDELTCAESGASCAGDIGCAAPYVCSAAGRCIEDPEITGCIADIWTGVGVYSGNPSSYRNLLQLQPDPAMTRMRIPTSANGGGADESLFESVACVADPTACSGAECTPGGIGCPAFRRDAVRMLVTITDETNQCGSCPVNTAVAAGTRLRAEEILFVGVDADASASPRMHLEAIARASNSLDASGAPLYVQGSEAAVTAAVSDAIRNIARNRPIFVAIESAEVDGDDGDALQFVDRIEVNASGGGGCTIVDSTADTDGDGFRDSYPSLMPGTPVCWDVVARDNDRIEARDRPLVFRARVTVRGDGSILDSRTVYFLVPPTIEPPIFG